jgi:hypothetical protein
MKTPPPKVNDLSGMIFGRLEIISYVGINQNRKALWECKCVCGSKVIVIGSQLLNQNTTSCGCYNRDIVRLPIGTASINKLYYVYKRNAYRRGLEFGISKEKFIGMIKLNCFYCNHPPSRYFKLQNGNGGIIYNGIDRINNSLGYIEDNIVPCCSICNYAKRNLSYDEFRSWAFDLVTNLHTKDNN